MNDIKSKPLFEFLNNLDEGLALYDAEANHTIITEEGASISISIEESYLTIAKQEYCVDRVDSVYISKESFEKLYKLYKAHEEVE